MHLPVATLRSVSSLSSVTGGNKIVGNVNHTNNVINVMLAVRVIKVDRVVDIAFYCLPKFPLNVSISLAYPALSLGVSKIKGSSLR